MARGAKVMGKPCRNGHPGVRYASTGQCVQCMQENVARWKAGKRERAVAAGDK
jgi:hypothetical protein